MTEDDELIERVATTVHVAAALYKQLSNPQSFDAHSYAILILQEIRSYDAETRRTK